jgi:hypothetical protein
MARMSCCGQYLGLTVSIPRPEQKVYNPSQSFCDSRRIFTFLKVMSEEFKPSLNSWKKYLRDVL